MITSKQVENNIENEKFKVELEIISAYRLAYMTVKTRPYKKPFINYENEKNIDDILELIPFELTNLKKEIKDNLILGHEINPRYLKPLDEN